MWRDTSLGLGCGSPRLGVGSGLPSSLPGGLNKDLTHLLKRKHLECFIGELESGRASQSRQDWALRDGEELACHPGMCVSEQEQSREMGMNMASTSRTGWK